jgi:hypothetical protein
VTAATEVGERVRLHCQQRKRGDPDATTEVGQEPERDRCSVLSVLAPPSDPSNPVVEHQGQPADYVHTDGTVRRWQTKRSRSLNLLGRGSYRRV